MFWQKELETMKRSDLEALQLERLKWVVDFCHKNVPFYRERLDKAGVSADRIKTLSDIQYIPYTTKDDIRDHYPYGLFGRPMKEMARLHASSGTTGKPTVVGYTKRDLDNWSDLVARCAVAVGATDEDICQIAFGYGLFTGALGLHYGLERIGASIIPISTGNTAKQIMLMEDFGTTLMVCTPSYALYLGEAIKEAGIPLSRFKLRLGLMGSEGCTPEMRAAIEERLGIFVTDNYGLSEVGGPGVSGECHLRDGLHLAEDHFLCEIIDPNTLLPLGRGSNGELVITTLTKEGLPLLRYRTKDISRIDYQPCACGRTMARMDKIKGRSDDMLKIKGVNVFPSQIESVLVGLENVGPHYMLLVDRKNFMDTLEVQVELVDEKLLENWQTLKELESGIAHKLKSVIGLEAAVRLVEPKTLARFEGKAKRVVDLRKQEGKL